jgi:hypothetical protein
MDEIVKAEPTSFLKIQQRYNEWMRYLQETEDPRYEQMVQDQAGSGREMLEMMNRLGYNEYLAKMTQRLTPDMRDKLKASEAKQLAQAQMEHGRDLKLAVLSDAQVAQEHAEMRVRERQARLAENPSPQLPFGLDVVGDLADDPGPRTRVFETPHVVNQRQRAEIVSQLRDGIANALSTT